VDFRRLVCSHALISRTFSSVSAVLFDCFFMSHTEPVACHFFTSLDNTRLCGNCQVGIFMTKLTDTFSISFFLAKVSTINTCCSIVNFISVQISTAYQHLYERLTSNVTYCSDEMRPPDGAHLLALMTHSAIGSYSSNLWEMLCPLYTVARFPRSLNAS
jgi:hypothetical protein